MSRFALDGAGVAVPVAAVGQNAYQASLMGGYANAWNAAAQTANRYGASGNPNSGTGSVPASLNISLSPAMCMRSSGRSRSAAIVGGNAQQVLGVGGAGYVTGDVVTFAPVNSGRPIKVQVVASAGAVVSAVLIDPGSGLTFPAGINQNQLSQTNPVNLAEASNDGLGVGATWNAYPAQGWGLGSGPMVSA